MPEPVTALQEWVTNDPPESPSGILVEYRADPRTYRVDGEEVPSVTTVLDILHKPALIFWGYKVGIEGLKEWWKENADPELSWDEAERALDILSMPTEDILERLKAAKLTPNHVRDKAADRGSSVHQAFEDHFAHGIDPNPDNYAPHEEGYVRALIKFIEQVAPEPVHSEIMVGSKRHGYAGRLDLAGITVEQEIKTGPRTTRVVPTGLGIIDAKTSKGVYSSHWLQLAGYSEAYTECGYGRANYEAVVLLRADGTFDFQVSAARPSQFLAVLDAWRALKGLK